MFYIILVKFPLYLSQVKKKYSIMLFVSPLLTILLTVYMGPTYIKEVVNDMVNKSNTNSNALLLYGFFVESIVRLSKIFVVECLYNHHNYNLIVVEKTFKQQYTFKNHRMDNIPTILNHMPKFYITILDNDFRMCIVI